MQNLRPHLLLESEAMLFDLIWKACLDIASCFPSYWLFFSRFMLPHSSNGVARSTRLLIRQSCLPQHHHQRSLGTAGLRIWGDHCFVIWGSHKRRLFHLKEPYFTITPFWNNQLTNLENLGLVLNTVSIPVSCPSSGVPKHFGQTTPSAHYKFSAAPTFSNLRLL